MAIGLTERWQHPLRAENLSRWEFLWASYEGGFMYLAQQYFRMMDATKYDEAARRSVHALRSRMERTMLRRHMRETDEAYDQRADFATPINIVRPLVETIAAAVSKVGKVTLPDEMEEFSKDVDGRGSDIQEFSRQVVAYVLVIPSFIELERRDPRTVTPILGAEPDAPPAVETDSSGETYRTVLTQEPERVPSIREVRDAGVRTYAGHVTALDLMHWSWDNNRHRFRWYLKREHLPLNVPPPIDGDGQETNASASYACKLVWEKTNEYAAGWQRFVDGKVVDSGPAYWNEEDGLPLFPVILNQDPMCAEPFGSSETEDASAIQRLILNLHSWYVDDLYNNAFHQMIVDTEELPEDADRVFGASTWIRGKGGQLLSPDPAVFDHMANAIKFHMRLARQRMGLEERGSDAAESGAALSLRRENFSSFLAGIATAVEGALGQAWRAATVMEGGSAEAVKVVFSKDFEAYNVAARLDAILSVWKEMQAALPPLAKAMILKDGVRGVTPEMAEDDRTKVDAAIDMGVEEQKAVEDEMRAAFAQKPDDEEEKKEKPPFGNGKDVSAEKPE